MGQMCVIIIEMRLHNGVGHEFPPLMMMMMMVISSLLWKHCAEVKWREIKQPGGWEEKGEGM